MKKDIMIMDKNLMFLNLFVILELKTLINIVLKEISLYHIIHQPFVKCVASLNFL